MKGNSMSLITDFYNQQPVRLKNDEVLTLNEILNKDNNWWNECHNFIQLLFPARTPSKMYLDAPILTQLDALTISQYHYLDFSQAIDRFGYFLSAVDMSKFNHNHLRITRMLESISLIESNIAAFDTLTSLVKNIPIYFNDEIVRYWAKAVGETW